MCYDSSDPTPYQTYKKYRNSVPGADPIWREVTNYFAVSMVFDHSLQR